MLSKTNPKSEAFQIVEIEMPRQSHSLVKLVFKMLVIINKYVLVLLIHLFVMLYSLESGMIKSTDDKWLVK